MKNALISQEAYAACRQKTQRLVFWSMIGELALMAMGWFGGMRVNLTPSEPLGLWRIVSLDRPLAVGDLVIICPPGTPAMRDARERGYLRSGLCPAGYAPLIKTVVGVEGHHVEVGAEVRVEGRLIASSRVLPVDGMKRPLAPYRGGNIPPGYVFLHSDFSGSFDSRYFGPIPASGVLGLAQEILTYAP